MSPVTVVAKLVIRENAVEAVKAELLKMIAPTRQEEGCIDYRLHQDNADPTVFIFYETWDGVASLERHLTTPHYCNYVAAVGWAVMEKDVYRMTCIA